jgi:alpha-ribazole phosphatase/probable phosphoglycerate mutase
MTRTRVHLLRHGQVEGHEVRRYNGQGDTPLTPLGRRQGVALGRCFAGLPLAGIYSSDLRRCRFVAEQIALAQQASPVYCSGLRELSLGEWEGQPWTVLQRDYPELWQARLADIVHVAAPGGETFKDLAARVRPLMEQIISSHRGDEIVIVAHGGVNRVLLLDALAAPLASAFRIEQDYACHNIIDYHPQGHAVVTLMNGLLPVPEKG